MSCPRWQKWHKMFCAGGINGMGCFVLEGINGMGYFVGVANCCGMSKMAWDVLLSDVSLI